ncbi:MAG: hypothetical protein EAX86_04365 [Candidatus Heimdallarchaeota archaeon]|nr:hypothetical protein [Candidatus Heimdallarchaeota archaeon]
MTNQKLTVLTLIVMIFIIVCNISTAQADYVVIDWGDVVNIKSTLNYRKPGEQTPAFYSETHIELFLGDIPSPYLNLTYDRLLTMFQAFREHLIGMREGQTRKFTVSYVEAGITNQSDVLYNAELIYTVLFIEMLYDAHYDPKVDITFTHPLILFPLLGLLFGTVYLVANGYHKPLFEKIRHVGVAKCINCQKPTNLMCANPRCRKLICSTCFSKHGCPICHGTKLIERTKRF